MLLCKLNLGQYAVDELWTTVKKQKRVKHNSPTATQEGIASTSVQQ
jgi:hypothetical protein